MAKLVQVFDQLIFRNEQLVTLLEGKSPITLSSTIDEDVTKQDGKGETHKFSLEQIEKKLRDELREVIQENSKLQRINTTLQADNHRLSNQV